MNQSIKTIAVDLTPVLPGGENGGAKIFVLELLRGLIERHPSTSFVLLTQSRTHDELAALDRPNVRRVMVLGPSVEGQLRPSLRRLVGQIYPRLPGRLRVVASTIAYKLDQVIKRGTSSSIVREVGADLLFCPFTAPIYFEPGVPTVSTIYDLQYKTHPDFFSPEVVANRDQTFLDACRKATVLAAISDYSRLSVLAHSRFDPERIRTIHLRLPQRVMAFSAEAAAATLDRYALAAQRYLIYPANFWQHKNHEMLLTAFGMACRSGLDPDFKLVCTGTPSERRSWIEDAADGLGLGDRVVFPGFVEQQELAALLHSSAGVVFPSLYEGFGLPIVEAMAAGVPVACSDSTSLPEVGGDAVVFFDARIPEQISAAMVTLASDPALRSRLIAAGSLRAREFADSARMVSDYWDLFQFAARTAKPADSLTGVHADGWAGAALTVQVAPGSRTLDLDFFAPEWLPQGHLTVRAKRDGRRIAEPLQLTRGARDRWSTQLEAHGGRYEFTIGPTFVPSASGMGNDHRQLSAMVQACTVTRLDGECAQLFPERSDA